MSPPFSLQFCVSFPPHTFFFFGNRVGPWGAMLWTSWLVLLLCWGATGSEEQADERGAVPAEVRSDSRRERSPPPVEPLDFGFVPAAVYDTHAYYEPGSMGILFHMVHAFLYIIQPNPFPKGEITDTSPPVFPIPRTLSLRCTTVA